MSAVTHLPARVAPSRVEAEGQLIGAVLHLGPSIEALRAIGFTGEEFSVELFTKVWKHVLRQAESGVRSTHQTVSMAGLARKALTHDDARQLDALAGSSTLTAEAFRTFATDFRLLVQRERTARSLRDELQRLEQGDFDPATTAGRLSGIERELHREAATISDLTGDQAQLLDSWDEHDCHGTSSLLATGIKVLDAEIGGLPQTLCLFAADAGVGKTALIDSMIHSMLLLHEKLVAGLISPEDGVVHVVERWLARETGWLLREIGNRPYLQGERERVQEIAARNAVLLRRILGYRERSITADGLIALCWQMAERGAGVVFIDNFNKIQLAGREDYHERVQRFSDRLQEFGEKAHVPVCLLVHTTGDDTNTRGKGVTASGGLQGGRALGRDARFRIDLHRKGRELRGTIAKANKLTEQGTVIQFSRQRTAGLIDPDTGEKINLAEERRLERDAIDAERTKRQDKRREAERLRKEAAKAAALEAKAAAEKAAAPPAQATLLEVPTTEKPDAPAQ